MIDASQHWETVYKSKPDAELSWTQPDPNTSLSLIAEVCPAGRVIDVGGGTSPLAARLLERGYSVTVLDLSPAAIDRARGRLGTKASDVNWIVADVTKSPSLGTFDMWHDRAVFHFLTEQADRDSYRTLLAQSVPQGGHAIIATFAPDGPKKCSGLEIRQYDGQTLAVELGTQFESLKTVPEVHVTPWGQPQAFQYSLFRRL